MAAAGLDTFDAAMAFQHLKQLGILRFRGEVDELAARRTLEGQLKPAEEDRWVPAATPHVARVALQSVRVPQQEDVEEDPLKLALAARDRGDFQEARSRALQAWAATPDSLAVVALRSDLESPEQAPARAAQLLKLAMAAHWGGDSAASLALCRRALAETELPDVHRQLALVLMETRAPRGDVETHLHRLAELQPLDDWAPRMLAWLREQAASTPPG